MSLPSAPRLFDPSADGSGKARTGGARPDVTVVVPTYCEAENLPELIARLCARDLTQPG